MDMIADLGNEGQLEMKTNQYPADYMSRGKEGMLDQRYRR